MSNAPRVIIDLSKLAYNFHTIKERLCTAGIALAVVVKGLAGEFPAVERLIREGMTELGDSRLENLRSFPKNAEVKRIQLRIPSLSRVEETVQYADVSLNSNMETLHALDYYAGQQSLRHQVFLMVDLGDLREGVSPADLPELGAFCRKMRHLDVVGLGTNFSCFAGAMPTVSALNRLVDLAASLRQEFHLPLSWVSGGNSSSLPLVYEGVIPRGINHLRIGEAILLGRETMRGSNLPDLRQDIFTVEAEVLQVEEKPSRPGCTLGWDAFGRIPHLPELPEGIRLLLNIGEQDTPLGGLTPLDPGITVLGGSSDYMVAASETPIKTGNILVFRPNYWSLLSLMTSRYVTKEYR